MNASDVVDIGRDALWVLMKMSGPAMLVALIVGLMISLFQALTQVQEMTLAFVPKIISIFITLIIAMPFMISVATDFMREIADRIASLH